MFFKTWSEHSVLIVHQPAIFLFSLILCSDPKKRHSNITPHALSYALQILKFLSMNLTICKCNELFTKELLISVLLL